mgnify:CR=1 FL=1
MLFAEALVIQCGDHSFAGAGSGDHQVAIIPERCARHPAGPGFPVGRNRAEYPGCRFRCGRSRCIFQPSGRGSAVPAAFIVIFKLAGIPVAFKSGCDLIDGLRQVFPGHFHVPFQPAENGRVGQVGGTNIRCGKAGVPVKHIGLCVEPGTLGVVAHLDLRIGQCAQLLNGFYVRSAI